MEFFCYHRDRPGSLALRDELLERHWAYMDRYAKTMIARGLRADIRPLMAGTGLNEGVTRAARLATRIRAYAPGRPIR